MYSMSEYAAAINPVISKEGTIISEINVVLLINIISPNKLIEGGAAILAADIMNQSMVIVGNRDIMPFVMYILRV